MFVVYTKVTPEEIREDAQEAITGIEEWFKSQPKRRVCRVEFWYGRMFSIKKKNIAEQVNKIADECITGTGRYAE